MAQMEQRTRRGTTAMQTKIGIRTWFRDAERGLVNEIMADHLDLRWMICWKVCLTLTSCSDCLCKPLKGWKPVRRFSLLIFLHISVLTMFMMENLGREWCAWCLGRPQGFGCSGGARRRSWCSHWTPRQASSRTLWVLDWFSSLLVTNYGLLVIRQCKRIVIFSIHMMIETHLTAHSGIYMTAGKSYCSLLSTFILSLLKKRIP